MTALRTLAIVVLLGCSALTQDRAVLFAIPELRVIAVQSFSVRQGQARVLAYVANPQEVPLTIRFFTCDDSSIHSQQKVNVNCAGTAAEHVIAAGAAELATSQGGTPARGLSFFTADGEVPDGAVVFVAANDGVHEVYGTAGVFAGEPENPVTNAMAVDTPDAPPGSLRANATYDFTLVFFPSETVIGYTFKWYCAPDCAALTSKDNQAQLVLAQPAEQTFVVLYAVSDAQGICAQRFDLIH